MLKKLLAIHAVIILLFASGQVRAELLAGKHDSLESAILKQKRDIDVFLPKDFDKEPARRYETIYVLDGDWNAKIVVQTVEFLQSTGFMPPVIVVSVPNYFDDKGVNSRDRDLTPSSLPNEPRSGGAPQFMAFLKTELIPYVNQHYPSNGVNLVHGHSYGGLFLTYVIANDPTIFDGYLILDPAMWWDNFLVAKTLEEKLPSTPTKGKAVYIAGRSGQAFKGMGIDHLQPVFESKAPASLHWQLMAYPNETHDSLKFKGTYDALRYAYRGYTQDKIDVNPSAAVLADNWPILIQAHADRFDIHYTTDGSEPTASSPKMGDTLLVNDPMKLRVKSISTRGVFDQDIPLGFKKGAALQPARAAKEREKMILDYAYYPVDAWPNYRGKPFEKGHVEDNRLVQASRDQYAGVAAREYVIPSDGYYALVLRSSQKSRAFFAGKQLLDVENNDRVLVVPLRAGVYRARVEYQHNTKDSRVDFRIYRLNLKDSNWDEEVK